MTETVSESPVRVFLKLNAQDNVATLLDNQTQATSLSDGFVVEAGVPFGHKIGLNAIVVGDAVVKYGVVIGHATANTVSGAHVHVHNLA